MSVLRTHGSPAVRYKRPGYKTQEVFALPSPTNVASWQLGVSEQEPAWQRSGMTRGSDNDARPRLGGFQHMLENTIDNLDLAARSTTAAEVLIRDAEEAADTLMMTRTQILLQVGVAALAQANQLPQTVVQQFR